jgi:hypothetical protein
MLGNCKLCGKENCELQVSHYMPAALYPKNIMLEYLPRDKQPLTEITDFLLCFNCEQRFNRRGESEVLRHIAGKIANKLNPIVAKFDSSEEIVGRFGVR